MEDDLLSAIIEISSEINVDGTHYSDDAVLIAASIRELITKLNSIEDALRDIARFC